MNTKLLMSASAMVLGAGAILLSFVPAEILPYFSGSGPLGELTLQLVGAAYFGFAMMNWMAKGNLIGGIYSKPLSIGNLAHFTIAALALIKTSMKTDATVLWIPAVIFAVFALLFARVSFTHPGRSGADQATSISGSGQ